MMKSSAARSRSSSCAIAVPDLFGLLNLVDERCGGTFDNIDDVIPPKERAEFMAGYKAAAGFAIETLNKAPPTFPPARGRGRRQPSEFLFRPGVSQELNPSCAFTARVSAPSARCTPTCRNGRGLPAIRALPRRYRHQRDRRRRVATFRAYRDVRPVSGRRSHN